MELSFNIPLIFNRIFEIKIEIFQQEYLLNLIQKMFDYFLKQWLN